MVPSSLIGVAIENFHTIILVIASITLFLYGLQSFNTEIKILAEGPLKKALAFATRNRVFASIAGAGSTALIQSSSATSALALGLFETGLLTLPAVLAIMIGVNIGTASTAFIISFKVQSLGAYFVILGALLSLLPLRIRALGKSIFFFGFILFSLDLISQAIFPLRGHPMIFAALSHADVLIWGLLGGVAITAVVQSSSVVIGMVILLANQNLISLEGAIAVVLGSNIGTTSTALMSSAVMGKRARAIAMANMFFNLIGVLIVIPFIPVLGRASQALSDGLSTGLTIAYSHLLFNVLVGSVFLVGLKPVSKFVERLAQRL